MEASGWSQQCSSPGQAGESQAQKNVSIDTSSRLLSDSLYKVRRPLFTQHLSILKKTTPAGHSVESYCSVQSPVNTTNLTVPLTQSDEPTAQAHVMKSSPGLQTREGQLSPHSKHLTSADRSRISPILSPRPPNSVLQVHKLSTPVRPRLSSPVLHPRYTPRSTQRGTQNYQEQSKSSPYQAEYWACAIPKDPPPTPGGDPHQDYEALLDYTYPLRPGPQGGDWTLQDSGIEMDLLSSGLSDLNVEQSKDFILGSSLPDLMGTSFSLEGALAVNPLGRSKQKSPEISSYSAALITLPLDWGIEEDEDEEFRPLPRQIEQLQQLSLQVHKAAARLQNVNWDPPLSYSVGQDTVEEAEANHRKDNLHHLWTEVESLKGLEQDSLMEHISVFCGHLEQLVRWLYTASQKIEQLAPPTVDIHSVKSSLAQYQSFQRDVNSHMPLTSSVLQTGHLLLRCIHSTTPVLRDTLLLIESQSRLLERHTEHFFSSILSAMDSLTRPPTDGLQPHPTESSA